MEKLKWYWLLPVFFLPGLFTPNEGVTRQMVINADMQFEYALKQFRDKDYETAVVELKRFVHFFPDDKRVLEARFTTGLSLSYLGRFHQSAKVFNQIIKEGGDASFVEDSYFMQSRAFIGMGNEGYARVVLQNLLVLSEDKKAGDKIYSLLADLDVQSSKGVDIGSLEAARKNLLTISDQGADAFRREKRLKTLDKALASPEKNPTLAGVLAIIPGGGFLYCQRPRDALVSFLLNTGLILGSYTAFDHDNPALGGVIAFIGTGFYSGNIYGSVTAAHRYNQNTKVKILGKEFSLDADADLNNKSWMIGLKYAF